MRQDKERSIREQADLWKGYWCILACILYLLIVKTNKKK